MTPSPERRMIVRELSDLARALDDEASDRAPRVGTWNDIVQNEIKRAAGVVRLVATLVLNGSYSERRAHFWLLATRDYLQLVRRTNIRGVIE